MKKSIVSAVILLAVLLGSCSGAGTDTQDSANSTAEATTQTSAVSIEADTAAVTTEAEDTADKMSVEDAVDGYTVYETSLEREENGEYKYNKLFEEIYKKWSDGEIPPEYYAVRFAENRDIAILIHNVPNIDSETGDVYITGVFHGGKWAECEIYLFANQYTQIDDMGDFIHIDAMGSSRISYSVFVYGGKVQKLQDEGKTYWFTKEDGRLSFYAFTTQYELQFDSRPTSYKSDDDFYCSFAEAYFKDGEVAVKETETYTISEWYMSDYAASVRESDGCSTWEEYKEKYINK